MEEENDYEARLETVLRLFESGNDEETDPLLEASGEGDFIDARMNHFTFDERFLGFVESLAKNFTFDESSAQIEMTIHILTTFINRKMWKTDEILYGFVFRSAAVLAHERHPPRTLITLFKFYQLVYNVRNFIGWLGALKFAIRGIYDETRRLDLRREMQKFIFKAPQADARSMCVIADVFEILRHKVNDRNIPNHETFDLVTRIADHFAEELTSDEIFVLLKAVRKAERVGEPTMRRIIKLVDRHPTLKIPVYASTWNCESNRFEMISIVLADVDKDPLSRIEMSDEAVNNVASMVQLLLFTSNVEWRQKARVVPLMRKEQVKLVCGQLKEYLTSPTPDLSPIADVLRGLITLANVEEIVPIYETIGEKVFEVPAVLEVLSESSYGATVFEKVPEFGRFGEQVKTWMEGILEDPSKTGEWRKVDGALKISGFFKGYLPSQADLMALTEIGEAPPFVMVTVMQLLRDHYGGIPVNLLERHIIESTDRQPKLLCLQYLTLPNSSDGIEPELIANFVDAALNAADIEIREEGLKVAAQAIGMTNRMADAVRDVLQPFKTHVTIGEEVKRILNPDEHGEGPS